MYSLPLTCKRWQCELADAFRSVLVKARQSHSYPVSTGISAQLNYNEAYRVVHRIRIVLITCMIGVLLFGICASYFLSRIFTRSIVDLNRTAAALAAGNMNARVRENPWWVYRYIKVCSRSVRKCFGLIKRLQG